MIKNYSSSFKFKVILEVIQGDLTIAQIMSKYQISKSVIHKWKKQFLDNGANVFSNKSTNQNAQEPDVDRLHATIGKLKVENDFLQKAWEKVKP